MNASEDSEHAALLEGIRKCLPLTRHCRYFNTASIGPVSTVYAGALARAMQADVDAGRGLPARYALVDETQEALRQEIAQILEAPAGQIVLTQSTTQGLMRVVDNIGWKAGDNLVTTGFEYTSCRATLEHAARRFGVELRVADSLPGGEIDPADISRRMDARTRLVVVSAVTFETGYQLPLLGIAAAVREAGAEILVDAAQGFGAIALNPVSLGLHYCAMPCQKWLGGPEGLGALYVSADASVARNRFQDGVVQGQPILAGALAQLRWLRHTVGWAFIFKRTQALAQRLRSALGPARDIELLTPATPSGISTLALPPGHDERIFQELSKRGYIVRHLPAMHAVRVATAFFNEESEVDELVESINSLTQA